MLQILSRNVILTYIKGHNSDINLKKKTGNNPNLDLDNINAYIKVGEILSVLGGNKIMNEIRTSNKRHTCNSIKMRKNDG